MAREFENKTIFITGAAKGQGRAVALAFAPKSILRICPSASVPVYLVYCPIVSTSAYSGASNVTNLMESKKAIYGKPLAPSLPCK